MPADPTLTQWLNFFSFAPQARAYVNNYLVSLWKASIWATLCECSPVVSSAGTCLLTWENHGANLPLNFTWNPNALNVRITPLAAGYTMYGIAFDIHAPLRAYQVGVFAVGGGLIYQFDWTPAATGWSTAWFPAPKALTSGQLYEVWIRNPISTGDVDLYYNTGATYPRNAASYREDGAAASPWNFSSWTPSNVFLGIDPIICTLPPVGFTGGFVPNEPTDPVAIPANPGAVCSTTADLCLLLNQVLARETSLSQDVNWIQTVVAPVCWNPGTALTGLTGAGTIADADLVGVYVTASVPSHWGRTAETPARAIPKYGEIQFAVSGVPASQHELHYDAEQVLNAPIAADSILYNFRAGVVGAITPLHRCK